MAESLTLYLYEEIVRQITLDLEEGIIPLGSKLPSLRRMSQRFGCSVSVVMQAYEVLEGQGKIYAVEKSGYFASLIPEMPLPDPRKGIFTLQSEKAEPLSIIGRIIEASNNPSIIPLGAGIPHSDFLPLAGLKRIIKGLLKDESRLLAEYTDELGDPGLRVEIARIMKQRGVNASKEDILITNGCSEALSLAVESCSSPGDTIVLESPVFLGIIQILNQLKRRIITIPTSTESGMDLDQLEEVLQKEEVKAVVMTALYQNPLGFIMPEDHRIRAAAMADRYGITLIEDDIYHDCSFRFQQERPIKSYDSSGSVIYCSSFSKTLSPGMRIGWLLGGRKHRSCRNLKMAQTLGGTALMQQAMAEFLKSPRYDSHLIHLQKIMARQSLEMSRIIREYFPEGTALSQPRGGYYLWVELPEPFDSLRIFEAALKENISIVPGQAFSLGERYNHSMRISFSSPIGEETERAVERLGQLILSQ